ncbi:hypothetical protein [Methanolobus bombayensis]|uniref:hypothetical protein n=1 Tax=Methanolobus bombayensis TaxID=38023 RepID=UPI001AE2567C|nr:hypothetical protein [Methanolobus bombayensis]MBP1910462.1 uncharacterized BrkB/YihY/UPF0761 family membrane protein [Methanolobus bombayensis]
MFSDGSINLECLDVILFVAMCLLASAINTGLSMVFVEAFQKQLDHNIVQAIISKIVKMFVIYIIFFSFFYAILPLLDYDSFGFAIEINQTLINP